MSTTLMTKVTIAEIAQRRGLKPDDSNPGGLRYVGPNPYEPGATEDGFHLFAKGSTLQGRDMGGAAWQRNPRRFYTSRQIAEFEGIAYEEYEGAESDPKLNLLNGGQSVLSSDKYDTRTLEERGLKVEAARFFRISGPLGRETKWGERRDFPTYHPNGAEGRKRRKYRFPAKQLETHPSGKPRKTDWDNMTKERGMPVGYGLNLVEPGDVVWIVNSELAVWLFWQENVRAICPLGEGRNEKNYREMLSIVGEAGASEIRVLLDNDIGGRSAAVRAWRAANMLEIPVTVHDLASAPKDGYDASDLYEFWMQTHAEVLPFKDFVLDQAVAPLGTLKIWERGLRAIEAEEGGAKADAALGELGRVVENDRTGEKRKCPKCSKFAVISSNSGGYFCFKKLDGCGEKFAEDDEDILAAKVKVSPDDISLVLLEMLGGFQLFHTDDGSCCIVIDRAGRRTTYDIMSTDFARWVRYTYHVETGKVLKGETIKAALETLAAQAYFNGPELKSNVRTAWHNGKIYIDLHNIQGEVVELDADGWRIISDCEVFFRRDHAMQELPRPLKPEAGKSNDDTWLAFKSLLNYGDETNWVLIVSWMATALYPARWPCPILSVHGEQGSAKSTLTKLVRQTLDPNVAMVIQVLIDQRETAINAEKQRIFALDNQDTMEKWASNMIAAMITGQALPFRKLFTDDDRKIFKAQPAMILNGIPEKVGGIDLNDRAVKLFIPKLVDSGYLGEEEIWDRWEPMRPYLLAAVLDAMSCGLRNLPRADEILAGRQRPRMADFTKWVMCCCEGELPFDNNVFYNAYVNNVLEAAGADLESFFPQIVLEFAGKLKGNYQGLAQDLFEKLWDTAVYRLADATQLQLIEESGLSELERQSKKSALLEKAERALRNMKSFPTTPGGMGTMLIKVAPSLRKSANLDCKHGKRTSAGVYWTIERRSNKPVTASLDLDADDSVFDEPEGPEETEESGPAYGQD